MFTRNVTLALAVVALAAAAAALLHRGGRDPEPVTLVERTRGELELRDGRLFEQAAAAPFDGTLVEFYPGKARKVAIEVRGGKPHGLSRGWYGNGQLEVEEHFVEGVAHGPRTRWYRNGAKRSEGQIVNGEVTGLFLQWHDNGQKAAEATIVDGAPHGVSRGWHRSGARKARVELRGGEVVSREYWEDTTN